MSAPHGTTGADPKIKEIITGLDDDKIGKFKVPEYLRPTHL